METILEELIAVLENQTDLQRSLIRALDQEKQAIVASDLDALQAANSEKANLIRKIERLEAKRMRTVADLRIPDGEKHRALTLKKIAQRLDEPYASRLNKRRNELKSLLKNVEEKIEVNKALLTHAMDLVSGSLGLLNNLMNANAVYYRSGKVQNKDHSGRVLSGQA